MKMFCFCEVLVEMVFYFSNLDFVNVCCYCGFFENNLNEEVDLFWCY